MRLIGDAEANGLLDTVDTIWCAVFKDLDSGEVWEFYPDTIINLPDLLEQSDECIMHNGMGYDFLLFEKILGYSYPIEKRRDTLVLSRLLNPDRKSPNGWKGIPAPHSIEAWGMRFGVKKPLHEDWTRYSPEMLHRCREDVRILELVDEELMIEVEDAYR